jgi:N-acetylneuraminic acid mutarotase
MPRMVWLPLFCVVSLAAPIASADPWSTRAPLLEAVQEVAVAELAGKLYVVGGLQGAVILDHVEVWDPATDAWSFAAPLPIPLHHTTATAVGGQLYVIGGWPNFFAAPTDRVFAYDPGADLWTEKASMPTARGSPAAAAVGGRIYVAGGDPGATDFAAYDPALDSWQSLPALPTGRQHLAAVGIAGRFYAISGRASLGAGVGNLAAFEVYDPGAGSWSSLPPIPTARSGLAAAAVSDRYAVAFGGEGNDAVPSGVFGEVEAYDTMLDQWIGLTPMPTPRHGIGAATLAGLVHVPGGAPQEGFGLTAIHEVYDPGEELVSVPELSVLGSTGRLALALALAGVALYALPRRVRSSAAWK